MVYSLKPQPAELELMGAWSAATSFHLQRLRSHGDAEAVLDKCQGGGSRAELQVE